jgi:ABC-type glutathione transport system ATPase component
VTDVTRHPRPTILTIEGLTKTYRSRLPLRLEGPQAPAEPTPSRFGAISRLLTAPRGRARQDRTTVLDEVSLSVGRGQIVGLVGESGSGKSTLARCIMGLTTPDAGTIDFEGRDLTEWFGERPTSYRRMVQIVFQHPDLSLDPRYTVRRTIAEVLKIHGIGDRADRDDRVAHLLEQVHLDPAQVMHRLPRQLSGGQRQRVSIARAIAVGPRLLVLDEPTSALDASVQTRVLDLLAELREQHGLSYLFISHDLAVIRFLTEQVVVLYRGRVVEAGPTEDVFTAPRDPYTRRLIASAPVPDPRHRYAVPGE